MLGGGEMPGLAVAPRQRRQGDRAPQQPLQEVVTGRCSARAPIVVESQRPASPPARRRSAADVRLASLRRCRAPRPQPAVNTCPSTEASWSSERSSAKPVEREATSAWRVSGTSRSERSPATWSGALLDEHAAVLEHPNRLHRVQRDSLRALHDLCDHSSGSPGTSPSSSPRDLLGRRAAQERRRAPAGRRSRSSGRPSVSTKIG